MIKMCLDIPDSFAILSKNKNGGYKVIWVLSILHFVIVFLINDRMIANKGDSYVNYSNANQVKYLLTKNEWIEYKKLREYARERDGLFDRRFES